jgi:hypothetical protein
MEYVIMLKQHYQWCNKVSPTDVSPAEKSRMFRLFLDNASIGNASLR